MLIKGVGTCQLSAFVLGFKWGRLPCDANCLIVLNVRLPSPGIGYKANLLVGV